MAGSFGSTPLPVTAAAVKLGVEVERNPDKFMRLTREPLIDKARYVILGSSPQWGTDHGTLRGCSGKRSDG